jgi:hypothetical protein
MFSVESSTEALLDEEQVYGSSGWRAISGVEAAQP